MPLDLSDDETAALLRELDHIIVVVVNLVVGELGVSIVPASMSQLRVTGIAYRLITGNRPGHGSLWCIGGVRRPNGGATSLREQSLDAWSQYEGSECRGVRSNHPPRASVVRRYLQDLRGSRRRYLQVHAA
jgi:hypothetical protein